MKSNQNLPALPVYVHHSFLHKASEDSWKLKPEAGTLVSVRAQSNQALQFSVLLESGALYTGLPINALASAPHFDVMPLLKAQAYDCICSHIEVIELELLRRMKCTYLPWEEKTPHQAYYLFTIDFTETGLARHPVQWKQFHVLENARTGEWVTYPQYRIQFQDEALAAKHRSGMPEYKYNQTAHYSEVFQ